MSRKPRSFSLCEADRQQLAHIVDRGRDWRARQRARSLLLLHSGKPINTVALEQGLNRDTVAAHRDTWLAKGIAGLFDAPRSGAPRKLAAEHVPALCDWARQEALSAPQLKDKLHEAFSVKVSTWVVQQALSREGFVWKRTRHSLKKKDATPLLAVPSPRSRNSRPKPSAAS
jgi:transposase